MQAIDALINRVSCGKLVDPSPTQEQQNIMFQAALRAADHGRLQPWRFLVVEGDSRNSLGQLYLDAALIADPNLSDEKRTKFLNMPHRAPLIIVAIAKALDHPKVPVIDQLMATAAAVQNLITAAFAQGVGAYWRTGAMAEDATVKSGLGVASEETIVGFIYLGTPLNRRKTAPDTPPLDFFTSWP